MADGARVVAHRQHDPVVQDPLRGIHFAALKAPGPSGLRPEHLSELMSVRRREANKFMNALGLIVDGIREGSLLEEARWITFSRTIFIGTKGGKKPRPIKVGELLRAVAARGILNKNEKRLRKFLARNHQFGIAISGGVEALVHWRTTLEEAIRAGKAPTMVIADLDMKNFFNT